MRFIVITSALHRFALEIGYNVSDAQALGGILRSDLVLPTSYAVAFSDWTPFPTVGRVESIDGRPEMILDDTRACVPQD